MSPFWTTVNASEALPGVVTPMTWSLFDLPLESGLRRSFAEMGVLAPSETRVPEDRDQRFIGLFHGRFALNMDVFRAAADRIPGTSGDALEAQFFGGVRPGVASTPSRRRYPAVAVRLPVAALRAERMVHRARNDCQRMWSAAYRNPPTSPEQAVALVKSAHAAMADNFHAHGVGTWLAQGVYDQLSRLCADLGLPGLELSLVSGFRELEESRMVTDLRAITGPGDLDGFLAEHGYHGPGAAELAIPSWRADPEPLRRLVELHRANPPDPAAGADLEAARTDAVARLMGATRGAQRAKAKALLWAGLRMMPLREVGRAGVLICGDTVRIAAEYLRVDLLARGVLDDPVDVYCLSFGDLPDPSRETAQRRKAEYLDNGQVSLPKTWYGEPETFPAIAEAPDGERPLELTGIAASPGTATGIARVITEPHTQDLDPGEVLVCRSTDPSWVPLFALATGVIVQVGSAMSHGAILSRELGLPCVINVADATTVIRTGDLVRLDGTAGTVQIVQPSTAGTR